jgi:hypothetical protein
MSEHTPQQQHHHHHHHHHHRTLDPTPVDASQTDLVVGDPPVPITVWRTARTSADTGRSIGARLAARLIAAYSRPGEAVVDLTADRSLITACTTGGRRHHPGWFTDPSSLIIGPASPRRSRAGDAAGEAEADVAELDVWFGDDLTDPPLPPHADPVTNLAPDTSLQHATSLAVACWPLDEDDAANRVRLAWLLTACARLLRPGGCLILAVAAGTSGIPEDFTPVVQAAAAVGLGYLQHIVAVTADTDGDAFIYHVTDEELLTLGSRRGQQWAAAHLRVHADLLVFSQTNRRPAGRRRRGGDDRG